MSKAGKETPRFATKFGTIGVMGGKKLASKGGLGVRQWSEGAESGFAHDKTTLCRTGKNFLYPGEARLDVKQRYRFRPNRFYFGVKGYLLKLIRKN